MWSSHGLRFSHTLPTQFTLRRQNEFSFFLSFQLAVFNTPLIFVTHLSPRAPQADSPPYVVSNRLRCSPPHLSTFYSCYDSHFAVALTTPFSVTWRVPFYVSFPFIFAQFFFIPMPNSSHFNRYVFFAFVNNVVGLPNHFFSPALFLRVP